MMRHLLNYLVTLAVSTASALSDGHQYHLGPEEIDGVQAPHDFPRLKCPLSRPLDPSEDGLLSSQDVFWGPDALQLMVDRHQPLVSIPSICYDDLGSFKEDKRWEPFKKIPGVLEDHYPNV